MGIGEGFLYGLLGGIFSEIFGLFRLRHATAGETPAWLSSPFYWIITVLMMFAGGGLVDVYLQSGIDLKAIVAVNIGASAPLIIGTLAAQVPRVSRVD